MNLNRIPDQAEAAVQTTILERGLELRHLSLELEGRAILTDLSFQLPLSGITALIGPSGAGKSSLLRCLNRLYEQWQGEILFAGRPLREHDVDSLRRRIALIGQKPAVFPCSVRDNLLFGLTRSERRLVADADIEQVLRQVALWPELATRLNDDARALSIGQQQRLCLARALMLNPAMLLLDEPTSALDPRSRDVVEESISQLARKLPVLWVTHDPEQAQRTSQQVIFICDGRLIEQGPTAEFFNRPERVESREYLRWRVCDCD